MHTEDMELLSVNFQHEGSAKAWLIIAEDSSTALQRAVSLALEKSGPSAGAPCANPMRHKGLVVTPEFLKVWQDGSNHALRCRVFLSATVDGLKCRSTSLSDIF